MELTDDVSIVALVVSLVALLLTVMSITQSFLGTAEGYRRCAQSVIGQWSVFRHRHWIWYEFRYETRFVIPQITLYTDFDVINDRDAGLAPFRLIGNDLKSGTVLHGTAHGEWHHSRTREERRLANLDDLTYVEKNISIGVIAKAARRFRGSYLPGDKYQRGLVVSWLKLIQEIHELYCSYWPQDCQTCASERTSTDCSNAALEASEDFSTTTGSYPYAKQAIRKTMLNTERTNAVVIHRNLTWDFLPSDTVRPLAESTIGDIVVLARRLGMHWRTLRLSEGTMQADGGGFAISSTDVRGLGLSFKFSTVKTDEDFPHYIPSVGGDKLLCGMLPGDSDLVNQDFDLVRDDEKRSIIGLHESEGLLSRLDVAQVIRNTYSRNQDLQEARNEIMILLMPFLVLPRSNVSSIVHDGLTPSMRMAFLYWEGRYALLKALELRKNGANQYRMDILQEVYDKLDGLRKGYRKDFFCRWNKAAINGWKKNENGDYERDLSGEAKSALIERCRSIFAYTTTALKDLGMADSWNARTKYMILVAAHFRLLLDTTEPVYHGKYKDGVRESQEQLSHDFQEQFPHIEKRNRGPFITAEMFECVRRYAVDVENGIRHNDHGIEAFFRRRGVIVGDPNASQADQCEAAWWLMMLRGIAWGMAHQCAPSPAGHAVPPLYYGNKTPVWIS
ncbi:hypothetical protein AMS68_000802 [Peltaster fructicola]|uniref:Uncharacterized protein n=1 Tax=Peltaster fructicola TaxID=286661 RepID=A0A6H0XKY5_9PEZI|nr:hypothetical protein AMS68_000802 [Peltaster fructicola]